MVRLKGLIDSLNKVNFYLSCLKVSGPICERIYVVNRIWYAVLTTIRNITAIVCIRVIINNEIIATKMRTIGRLAIYCII